MKPTPLEAVSKPARWLFWFPLTLALIGLMAYLRLAVFHDRLVPLAYGLPLLLFLYVHDLLLLYLMAAGLSALVYIKLYLVLPAGALPGSLLGVAQVMNLLDIWVVAFAVHGLIAARRRIAKEQRELEQANDELKAVNEDLAAHEEEIVRQNEELQSQAEELEQQTEELSQQSEELQQQSEELQQTNADLERRETALYQLLQTASWLAHPNAENEAMQRVCRAAVEVLGGNEVAAAAVVEREGEKVTIRGHYGFGPGGPMKQTWEFGRSFAAVVVECRRTASLRDTSQRPDIEVARPTEGPPFASVLASPLRVRGQVIGVLQVYGRRVHDWTDEQYKIIEWFAAHVGLLLEAVELQRELDQRRRDAEDDSLRKTRFLAAISHDVRTPANAINLLAELIDRSAAGPDAALQIPQLAGELRANARALVELVSDVLDVARFDSGKLDLQLSDVSLRPLLEQEIKQLTPLAQAKNLALRLEYHLDAVSLQTDRMKFSRILGNLIGNAIKFTERGSVIVRAAAEASGDLCVHVADTGVGILPEHQAHIFDEFFQLRNPERDRSKGSGLGLAICQRLVQSLGYRLTLESTPGQGSTFSIHIPGKFRRTSAIPTTPTPATARRALSDTLNNINILLVEDHASTRRAMASLLAAHGARITEAADARAGLTALHQEGHQVLLLDLMLPDMDGSKILEFLQTHRPSGLQCVLVVSGDVTGNRRQEVMRLGADGMLPKPIDLDVLINVLRSKGLAQPYSCHSN